MALKTVNLGFSTMVEGVVAWFLGTWIGPLLLVFLGLLLLSDFEKLQSFSVLWVQFSKLLLLLIGFVASCRVLTGIGSSCVFLGGTPLSYYIYNECGCRTHTNPSGGLIGVPQLGSPNLARPQLVSSMGWFVV